METVGPSVSTSCAVRSLVVVLPADPVIPAMVRPGRRRTTAAARSASAAWTSGTISAGAADRAGGQHGGRPGGHGRGGEVVAVGAVAGQRREQRARLAPPASRSRPARYTMAPGVGYLIERGAGDLGELRH